MKTKALLTLCLFTIFCFAEENITTFNGKAYNDKNQHLFTEEYTISKKGEKITSVSTIFKDPKGAVVATMDSDFSSHEYVPAIRFEKEDDNFSYGSTLIKSSLEVFKTTGRNIPKMKKLEMNDTMVAGPGFYFYVLSNLEKLMEGKEMKISFVQPNRLNFYTFTMKTKEHDKKNDHVTIHMKLDNKLLKAFVPDIELTIQAKNKTLVSYEGLSGFLSDGTNMKKVKIDYSEPICLTEQKKSQKN